MSGLLKFSSNLYFGKWKTRSERVTWRPRNIWKTTQLDTRRKHSRSSFILKSTYRLFFVLVARGLQDSAACQTFKWIVHPKSGSIIIYLSYVVVNSWLSFWKTHKVKFNKMSCCSFPYNKHQWRKKLCGAPKITKHHKNSPYDSTAILWIFPTDQKIIHWKYSLLSQRSNL